MRQLKDYIDERLSVGKGHFVAREALLELDISPEALTAAANRLKKQRRLVSPRRGFYLIVRPEDRFWGAPDPLRWIDPLMQYLSVDYRVSLLRAAAYHGAGHEAAKSFQVIAPRQLRSLVVGQHKVAFIYQTAHQFVPVNQSEWTVQTKSETGYVSMAGRELILFDLVRYMHKAGGVNGVAQSVKELGGEVDKERIKSIASKYEKATVRRLGYLLSWAGHKRLATALLPWAEMAKSIIPLDTSVHSLLPELDDRWLIDKRWQVALNTNVETAL